MGHVVFDLDALRSFATGMRLGSFAKAAERLGRSTSAISAQLKKLEMQANTPLFRKAGRGLALTDAGQTMLTYAHRLMELNDEVSAAMRGADLHGWVRVGLQEEFGESLLPQVLGRFARAHPKVRVEACLMRCAELRERLQLGKLDLALVWETGTDNRLPHAQQWLRAPLQWLVQAGADSVAPPWWGAQASGWDAHGEPLPLILLSGPCPVSQMVTTALDKAGIAWRHAFSSASLSAVWAATGAGLGVAVRTSLGRPAGVMALAPSTCGLPMLAPLHLVLYRAQSHPQAAVDALAQLLRQAMPATQDNKHKAGRSTQRLQAQPSL